MDTDFSSSAIIINSAGMGHGDESLCQRLLTNYLRTLAEMNQPPQSILLYAAGARMAAHDSPCRTELTRLGQAGSKIIVCRTCLEFFGLLDSMPEAEIGNMLLIAEAQGAAARVITL